MSSNVDLDERSTPKAGRANRGVLAVLAGATAIGSTGMAAGGTAGALLVVDLAGTSALAGVPVALHLIGAALGALLVSHQAGLGHRGRGLALGFVIGLLGAAVVIFATMAQNLLMMLVGSVFLGTANSSIFLTRYAAAAATETNRGRTLGAVFLATSVGAVISPALLGPAGAVARTVGLSPLSGLYLVAAVAFGISALLFAGASSPRVPVVGRAAGVLTPGRPDRRTGLRLFAVLNRRPVRFALLAMAGTNFVMVGVMTIAPVHLTMHGHSLAAVGWIVAVHVACMFGAAPMTGYVVDRYGSASVVLVGGLLLAFASILGAVSGSHGVAMMTVHLLLLGLGWNCGVVGGSTLLTDAVAEENRPHTEGIGEATMSIAAVLAAPAAGVVSELGGYQLVSLCALVISVSAVLHLSRSRRSRDKRWVA